jgi:hypothetical protein
MNPITPYFLACLAIVAFIWLAAYLERGER